MQRHAKGIMFGGVGLFSKFDWDKERFQYDVVKQHFDDIDFVWRLKMETMFCALCNQRNVIDCKVDGVEYCTCYKDSAWKNEKVVRDQQKRQQECEWKPYLERKNMIIWRKEEKPGLYAYKSNSNNKR